MSCSHTRITFEHVIQAAAVIVYCLDLGQMCFKGYPLETSPTYNKTMFVNTTPVCQVEMGKVRLARRICRNKLEAQITSVQSLPN